MPASAASLIPADEPVTSVPRPRRSLGGWMWIVFLVAAFAYALYTFPPLTDASKAVPAPEWALMFGRFHPIAVHLPVGVLFLAALMDVLAIRRGALAEAIKPTITFVMGIGAFGAIIAVIFGVLLSREGGYGAATFKAHQFLGITTAVLSILAFACKLISDDTGRYAFLHRIVMVTTLGVMSIGAHMGGNLVHGDQYLLDHAPVFVKTNVEAGEHWLLKQFGAPDNDAPTPDSSGDTGPAPALAQQPGDPGNPTVYTALVAPLMHDKCASCHNAEKSRGELRLDTHEFMLKGGENGNNIVVGQPEKSLMITRMLITKDNDPDDEHMPPFGKPQFSKEEIDLLTWWIKEGASKDLKVSEAKFPEELKPTVTTLLANSTTGGGGSTPPVMLAFAEAAAAPVDPAIAEAMKKINGSGASLAPIATDVKQLRFTALNVAKDYTDANLKDLEPIAGSIVALDLAKSKVTDAACDVIAKMANLKELHLENTAVTDAGAEKLKGLANLEYLNLYGSKVTDKSLAVAEALPKLKSLYVWQTGVTRPAADALKAKKPGLMVNTGWTEADNAKVVAAPTPPPASPAPATAAATPKPAIPAPAPVPAPAPAPAPAKPAEVKPTAGGTALAKAGDPNAKVFADVVLPILTAKCASCHGAEKSKGKLRLHTFADALKGGGDGATTVIASNTKDSLMLVRAKLPKDDDDHMPPSDEPQLTKEELALLEWWIAEGAKEDITIGAAKKTPEIEGFLKALASSKAAPAAAVAKKDDKPKAKPLTDAEKKAVAEVTAKMAALNASLMPLALDTEQLRLGVVNAAEKFDDKALAELATVAPQLAWVDLARSKVTDDGLATVAKMSNLERLHLENTAVTDAGLAQLAGLAKLEYLNLYGTKITDAGIAKLSSNKALKKLFVWQTAVTKDGAKKLEAAVPGLVVNVGLSEAEIAKLIEAAKPPPPPAPEPKKEEKKPEPPKPAPATPAKPDAKAVPAPAPNPPPAKPDAAKPAPAPPPQPDAVKPAAPPAPAPPAPKPDEAKKN